MAVSVRFLDDSDKLEKVVKVANVEEGIEEEIIEDDGVEKAGEEGDDVVDVGLEDDDVEKAGEEGDDVVDVVGR